MKISLIVATRGRRDELTRLLDSLVGQTFRDFEVIVIDQNPEGFLLDVLTPFANRLRLIHASVTPSGVSAARNAGLRLVEKSTDVLAFPDDDCWYEPETLRAMAAFFEAAHPERDCVIGRWKTCRRESVNRYSVFYQGPTWLYALRKCWADRIGGFDEAMGPGPHATLIGGEDTDYLLRGLSLGMKIAREPDIVIHHPDMPMSEVAEAKVRGYGLARMALLAKHGYPLWFKLANVAYPLVWGCRHPSQRRYWQNMFLGRVSGFFHSPT